VEGVTRDLKCKSGWGGWTRALYKSASNDFECELGGEDTRMEECEAFRSVRSEWKTGGDPHQAWCGVGRGGPAARGERS